MNWELVLSVKTGQSLHAIEEIFNTNDFDVLIVNGEGTLHDNNNYSGTLIEACKAAKKLGKRVVLINSSIYLTCQNRLKDIATYVDLVTVRTKSIQLMLSTYNIKSICVPDLSFLVNKNVLNENEISTTKIDKKVMYTDSVSIKKTLTLIHCSIINRGNYVPFIFPPAKNLSLLRYIKRHFVVANVWNEYLYALPVSIYNFLKSRPTIQVDKAFVDSSKVVTGRFHAVCFCIRLRVPFDFMCSNTPKVEDLLRDVDVLHLFTLNEGVYEFNSEGLVEYINKCDKYMGFVELQYEMFYKELVEM
jgi:polysaccharide pyruvyl transferase WcaK-like protein